MTWKNAAATVAAVAVPLVLMPGAAHADPGGGARRVTAEGELVRYPLLVGGSDVNPVLTGATARVRSVETPSGKTIVKLIVEGLEPNRAFGSHVHTMACGSTPTSSGGHYMHDPSGPATPENEVWLDFVTNAQGRAEATAVVDWQFARDAAHPTGASSVVVHRDPTSHGDEGHPPSGVAGPRLACLTVPFTS